MYVSIWNMQNGAEIDFDFWEYSRSKFVLNRYELVLGLLMISPGFLFSITLRIMDGQKGVFGLFFSFDWSWEMTVFG